MKLITTNHKCTIIIAIMVNISFNSSLFAQIDSINSNRVENNNSVKYWSMDECMMYGIKHSTSVKKKEFELSTTKIEKAAAITAFLPNVNASISSRWNWGRNIDPNTNTYNNLTTFNNNYDISASMTLFDGGQLYNQLRQARIANKQGYNDVQRAHDDKAIEVMQAYIDVVYYQEYKRIAKKKLNESLLTLKKTESQFELGIKGKLDVAQVKAQVAEDDYNVIHQDNLFKSAMLKLKSVMNCPITDSLQVDTIQFSFIPEINLSQSEDIYNRAFISNPLAIAAKLNEKNYKMQYNISKGRFIPTITLSAGISTSYNRDLLGDNKSEPFRYQFKNNTGKGVMATLSIPIFNNLNNLSSMRRARNLWKIAQVEKEENLKNLRIDIEQAVMDCNGYAKEIFQMVDKVQSDSLAYQAARRKYEEGLLNAIDLQTTSNTLLNSQVTLLQKRLLYTLKKRLVEYYRNNTFIYE